MGSASCQDNHAPEAMKCTCGTVLMTPVSLATRTCAACRWEFRHGLGPAALRLLARSFRDKGLEHKGREDHGAAADYFAEAQACDEKAVEREAPLMSGGARHG